MCAAVMFLETATGMMMGGGKYVKLEPRTTYTICIWNTWSLKDWLSVDRFSTAVKNAAKELGNHYLTRKIKGRTQTNVKPTELVNGFLMTLANLNT